MLRWSADTTETKAKIAFGVFEALDFDCLLASEGLWNSHTDD